VGLAEVIPYFCVAPFAGYLVDHLRRRRLGAVACAGLAITALVLVAITQGWLPSHGTLLIYGAIALTGSVRSFLTPIYNTLFARILPRTQFARGAGSAASCSSWGWCSGRRSVVRSSHGPARAWPTRWRACSRSPPACAADDARG
jgi:MFS family permease